MNSESRVSLCNHAIQSFIGRLSSRKSWHILLLSIALATSMLSFFPYYTYGTTERFIQTSYGQGIKWWLDHPFKPVPVEMFFPLNERHIGSNAGAASHLDKLTFRALLPIINQVVPLGNWTIVFISQLANIAILFLCYYVVYAETGDKNSGFFTSLAVSASFSGQWGFQDYICCDSLAVALLLAAMLCKKPFYTISFLLAASLTDERAITTAPLVLFFHSIRKSNLQPDWTSKSKIQHIKNACAFLIFLTAYFSIRIFLIKYFAVSSGTSRIASVVVMRTHLYCDFPLAVFRVFEFLWIVPILFLIEWYALNKKNMLFASLFVLFSIIAIIPALLVVDIDRSLFYYLPGIIISVCFLPLLMNAKRFILLAIFILNFVFLFPQGSFIQFVENTFYWNPRQK